MKKMFAISLGVAVLIAAVGGILWLRHKRNNQEEHEAARSLEVLKQLITKENYQNFGLRSLDEVSNLQLGQGADVFFVFNNDLKEFGRDSKLASVVKRSQSRIYPVLVNGEGRLLITLRKHEGTWRVASFGESDVAYNLAKLEEGRNWLNLPKTGLIAVQIPARHLSFASFGQPSGNDDLLLTPLNPTEVMVQGFGPQHTEFFQKHSKFTAEEHGIVSAKEVLAALADTASTGDDSAP
jgi:hypothetical protein